MSVSVSCWSSLPAESRDLDSDDSASGANSCNKWTGGKCKSHLFITAIFIKIIRGSDFSAETAIEMTLQNVLHITELRVADPCGEPRRQRGGRVLPRPQLAADGGCSGALKLQDCTAAPLSCCSEH